MTLQSITIRRPDDWHVHLRDGEMLKLVAPYTARQFARAIVMPNLAPPVTSVEAAAAYRERIVVAAGDRRCRPLLSGVVFVCGRAMCDVSSIVCACG